MIYTNIDQSTKLLKLGLQRESASAYYEPAPGYMTQPTELKVGEIRYAHPRSVPAWSFEDLMNMIPQIGASTPMLMKSFYVSEPRVRYHIDFFPYYNTGEYPDMIDAAFEMICWLFDNDYITKK
jgi:hypothetical protein